MKNMRAKQIAGIDNEIKTENASREMTLPSQQSFIFNPDPTP